MTSLHSGLGMGRGGEVRVATPAQPSEGKQFRAGVKSQHVGVRWAWVSAMASLAV